MVCLQKPWLCWNIKDCCQSALSPREVCDLLSVASIMRWLLLNPPLYGCWCKLIGEEPRAWVFEFGNATIGGDYACHLDKQNVASFWRTSFTLSIDHTIHHAWLQVDALQDIMLAMKKGRVLQLSREVLCKLLERYLGIIDNQLRDWEWPKWCKDNRIWPQWL